MKVTHSKIASIIVFVFVAAVALAGCAPAATPTAVPPATPTTAPPAPPTAVPPAPTPAPTAAPTAPAPTAVSAKPVAVKVVQNDALGKFLADGDGRTLYMFARDSKSTTTCSDACAQSWPPFITQAKTEALEGVNAALIGTTQRKEGTNQVTYNGWPLYYRGTDTKAGDTTGHGIGNVWWVLIPNGDAVTAAPPPSITINLGAGRDADQSGTARLTARGNKTEVVLNIKPGAAGVEQPAHIHEGACPAVGAVKYPLTNLTDGRSTTTVDVPLASLLTGGFSINAHKSAAEIGVYVACGGIAQGVLLKLGPGRDADQSGSAVLLAQGNKTEVNVFIKPVPPLVQPAHIHEGACPGVGAVKYPLTNIEFGSSKTVVEASLADLLKGGYSINAHKSANDMNVYVACGAVSPGT